MKRCRNRVVTVLVLLSTLIGASAAVADDTYPDAPAPLVTEVQKLAADVVAQLDTTGSMTPQALSKFESGWRYITVLAVADALSNPDTDPLGSFAAIIYAGESRSTNKQIGAGSGSAGSTTLVESASFPDILAFAIENGAVQQQVSGTNITLSTSAHAMIMLLKPRSPDAYFKYGLWRRVGASASFPVNQAGNDTLGHFDPRTVSEWSLNCRLFGDRSTRSAKFSELWKQSVSPKIVDYVRRRHAIYRRLFSGELAAQKDTGYVRTSAAIAAYINHSQNKDAEDKKLKITNLILGGLATYIHDPVVDDEIQIDDTTRTVFMQELMPGLLASQARYQGIGQDISSIEDEVNHSLVVTLRYTNHREPVGTSYSELKLLADGFADPIDILFNAGIALNHHPNTELDQSTIREVSVSGSFILEFDNPFRNQTDRMNHSRITASGSGKYAWSEDLHVNTGFLNARVDIPFSRGLSLPISMSYIFRNSINQQDDIRANFGIMLDLDKLYASARSSLDN